MSEPWFDVNIGAWLGAGLGIYGGLVGTVCGTLAPRGKCRALVLGVMWAGAVGSLLLLAAGVAALLAGQPYAIWYGLGLPGLIGTILFPSLLPVVRKRYAEAELRRAQAVDL